MIGIFDSGLGGLTILHELVQQLPQYSYVYFGDNAHAPYGNKQPEEVYELTVNGVQFLFNQGAQLVILGCNTASVSALRKIQSEWLLKHGSHQRVLGIVVPTIEQITGANWRYQEPITTPLMGETLTVGVLATPLTVNTGVYTTEIHKRNQSIHVIEQACAGLVEAIEKNNDDSIRQLLEQYTRQLQEKAGDHLTSVLLGCTHYELIRSQIQTKLPARTKLLSQPSIVAKSLTAYLHRHPEVEIKLSRKSHVSFWTSGSPAQVDLQGQRYYRAPVKFQAVE